MPTIDKTATPLYEKVKNKVMKYSVVKEEIEIERLENEKAWMEKRIAEINEILGVENG